MSLGVNNKLKSASDTNDYSNIDTSSNELLEKDSKINDLEKQLESLISELKKKDNQINELEDKINHLESNFIKNEDTNSSIEVE
jgi:septal ring factor EnvC (AmiA/AmiB activator)